MKKLLLSFSTLLMCTYGTILKAQTGNFLTLNGTSQYMSVNDATDLNLPTGQSLTFTMRIKLPASQASGFPRPISKVLAISGGAREIEYSAFVGSGANNGKIAGNVVFNEDTVNNYGATNFLVPSPSYNDDAWHHLTTIFTTVTGNTVINFYLDGTYIGGSNNNNNALRNVPAGYSCSSTAPLLFGAHNNNSAFQDYLKGSIDDIRIYNYAMSSTDINTDRTTAVVNGSTPGLVAAWDFEAVSGATVPDVSGKGHNGTLVNAPAITLGLQSNVLNENNKLSVAVSPNPTADLLNIKVNNANGPITIKIIDLSGKTIHTATISDKQETAFSLKDQAKGVYVVQVKDANGTINKKVIKK